MSDAATTLKPSEVLEKAADLIEPDGAWTQRRYGQKQRDGSYVCWCVYGAVDQSATAASVSMWKAWDYLELATGVGEYGSAINWNDAPGRTQPEVVAALRKAAELARGAGQ